MFFLGPQLQAFLPANPTDESWVGLATAVWRYIVRPVAVGSMMVGTGYTLFRMRKNLIAGLGKAFSELKGGAPDLESLSRQGALEHPSQRRIVVNHQHTVSRPECRLGITHRRRHAG